VLDYNIVFNPLPTSGAASYIALGKKNKIWYLYKFLIYRKQPATLSNSEVSWEEKLV
jgi:hypothetical protein